MTTEFAFYMLRRRLQILGGLELLLCVAARWLRAGR